MGRKVLSGVRTATTSPAPVASASPAVAEAMQRARAEVAARDEKQAREVSQMAKTATATLPLPAAPTSPAPRTEPTRSASTVPTSTSPAAAPAQVALAGGADTIATRILAALELTAKTQAEMTAILSSAVQMQAETVKLLSAMRELHITSAPAPAPVTSAPAPVAPAAAPAPAPAPAPKASVKAASKASTTPKSDAGAPKAREKMAKLQELRARLVAPGKIVALDTIIAGINAGTITDAQIASASVDVPGIAADVIANVCAKITRIAGLK
jgi:hypothetical protein